MEKTRVRHQFYNRLSIESTYSDSINLDYDRIES